jgi:hypothetical protein
MFAYAVLACGWTWVLATPALRAWMNHATPSPLAVACAGLSAFGPLLAAVAIAGPQHQLGAVFGHWRTNSSWIGLALATPVLIHLAATTAYVAIGGVPDSWFHPPATAVAALVVFPLGEEFGWRGFLHPRAVGRFGLVRGSLVVGLLWGLWHLAYSVTPEKGGFDAFAFGMTMVELPLYSLPIAWVFERSNRSMAVAIAFHAGAHLDHIERAPRVDLRLHVLHLVIAAVVALVAALALSRRTGASPLGDEA